MRFCFLILIASLTLAACGTKGDLYIPEQQYPQEPLQQNQPSQ
ncbi:lipoprotein [Methylobacillus arboreus]|nr:lipoprotein [Methylobacillus arboreus]MCB5190655.1 lipoprotein [Methylobacillus arboreus]